jgi:hypothetical protein
MTAVAARAAAPAGTMLVLLTLAAGQFLMTLDSSVMNVSIATVANDVGTTVTGIQGAITAYTLVMAALMIVATTNGEKIWAFRYSSEHDSRSLYFSTRMDALKALYPESEELQGPSPTRPGSSSRSRSATYRVRGTRRPSRTSASSSRAPTS